MFTPKQTTHDGFELQFGTNHLGPFALTGLLLEQMLPVPGSRVVTGQQRRAPHPGPDQLRRPAGGAVLPPGGRIQPIQAGEPDVHLRTATPAIRGGHHHRRRRPPRPSQHRADAQLSRDRRVQRASDQPECGDGRTAHAARPRPTPACSAASTTAQTDSSGPGATRNWPSPAGNPTTRPSSAACGPSRKDLTGVTFPV